jgi:hypothetical protein
MEKEDVFMSQSKLDDEAEAAWVGYIKLVATLSHEACPGKVNTAQRWRYESDGTYWAEQSRHRAEGIKSPILRIVKRK